MSKKAAKPQKEFRTYSTGDPVLGKVRGYPPWPGVVVDPADAPPAVLSEQPPGKKPFFHCILFFPMGDYAWLHSKDLSSLKKHEIEAFLADDTKKRNGDLREGYRIALDPQPWMTNRQQTIENAQVDELASENEDADGEPESGSGKKAKASSAKKRKRESDAGAEPKKAAVAKQKKKAAGDEPAKKKAATASTKGKKNGARSKAMVESEDEGAEAEDDDDNEGSSKKEKSSPPPAKKVKRDKDEPVEDSKDADPQSVKVRDWRHRLQKTFLSNKAPPKAEAMPELDELFTTVERYEEMTIEQLQFSKIGKVMRHIASLADDKVPPRDDEFKFRARAKGLVDKWHQILNANKGAPATSTTTNGAEKEKAEDKETKEKEEKEEAAVTEKAEKLDLNGGGSAAPASTAADADADAAPATTTTTADAGAASTEDQTMADAPADDEQDAPAEADTSLVSSGGDAAGAASAEVQGDVNMADA
ncbi:hypothetical protein CPC08DRAFT_715826 [Agrocybe pediades]|nr:hypothetical protein CPC08DRAFT_715826 [Agrocybe pediades]